MSRLLRINDIEVNIDEKTSIGLDLQSYDVKDVGKAFVTVSNTFNVPLTSNNLSIFGLANDPQSKSTKVYETAICNYWLNNDKIINNAKIRVENINDRINLFIFEKQDFWEDIKRDLWPDFVDELLVWLNSEKGLPIQSDPFTGLGSAFLDSYYSSTSGVFLPYFIGNFGDYVSVGQRQAIQTKLTGTGTPFNPSMNVVVSHPLLGSETIYVAISGFTTLATLAAAAAILLNSNTVVSQYFIASSDGDSIILTRNVATALDSSTNMAIVSFSSFVNSNPTSTILYPGIPTGTEFLETTYDYGNIGGAIYLRRETNDESGIGGHFCVYVRTLFEFIEYKYNVNLLTSGGVLPANIWDDVIAQKLYIPIRELDVYMRDGNSFFRINRTDSFLPLTEQKDKADKLVYDFVVSFMNHLNIIKDEFKVGSDNIIRFARFDDIEDIAEVVDFSGKITGTPNFKPRIDGYAQNNYIKFKEVYPEGSDLANSKLLTCLNVNLDINADLIEIDAYVPSIINSNSESYSYLGDKESFNTFTFYISDTYTSREIVTWYYEYSDTLYFFVEQRVMQIAEIYNLADEYNFLDEIIDYPKMYDVEMWLTMEDIRNFEFFKQYWIKELNGAFFINKISGFNPEKSKNPTKVELLKIGNRTPVTPPDLNYWADGVEDAFVDGEFDYYY